MVLRFMIPFCPRCGLRTIVKRGKVHHRKSGKQACSPHSHNYLARNSATIKRPGVRAAVERAQRLIDLAAAAKRIYGKGN